MVIPDLGDILRPTIIIQMIHIQNKNINININSQMYFSLDQICKKTIWQNKT